MDRTITGTITGPSAESALAANDLLLFQRVADTGSFSRAAAQLGLPRSYVSRHLAALEARLGEKLFHRSTRRLALTDFGLGLVNHTRELRDQLLSIDQYVASRSGLPAGRLRVSMPPDFADQMLPADFFPDFLARYPDIRLELDTSARWVDVIGEQFDLAIRAGRSDTLPDDATLVARPLLAHRWGVYASAGYLARHGTPAHPDDLAHHVALALRLASGQLLHWSLFEEGNEENPGAAWQGLPPVRFQCNSLQLLLTMALRHQGIVLLGRHHARAALAAGALQRILPRWQSARAQTWLVMPGRRLVPAGVRALIAALEAGINASQRRLRDDMPLDRLHHVRTGKGTGQRQGCHVQRVQRKHVAVDDGVVPRRAGAVVAKIIAAHVVIPGKPLRVIVDALARAVGRCAVGRQRPGLAARGDRAGIRAVGNLAGLSGQFNQHPMIKIHPRQAGGDFSAFLVDVIGLTGHVWVVAQQNERLRALRHLVPGQMRVAVLG